MEYVNDQRTYNSPLRAKQTQTTRVQILDALIDLINDVGAQDLNIKDLARRAGVSERTVYRHFPDRTELIDGLFEQIDERAAWMNVDDVTSARQLTEVIPDNYRVYDEFERETRALVLMNFDPARLATQSKHHVGMIEEIVARSYPDLDEDDVTGIAAVFGLLPSSRTWLRLLDGNGLSGVQSARYLQWAGSLITEALDAGRTPAELDPPDEGDAPGK